MLVLYLISESAPVEAVSTALADLWPNHPLEIAVAAEMPPGEALVWDGERLILRRDGRVLVATATNAETVVRQARIWLREPEFGLAAADDGRRTSKAQSALQVGIGVLRRGGAPAPTAGPQLAVGFTQGHFEGMVIGYGTVALDGNRLVDAPFERASVGLLAGWDLGVPRRTRPITLAPLILAGLDARMITTLRSTELARPWSEVVPGLTVGGGAELWLGPSVGLRCTVLDPVRRDRSAALELVVAR